MQQRNLIIIGLAILAGLIAVYLVNAYFSGVERQQEKIAEQQEIVRIVVASQDLEFGTPLTSSNVRMANWPAKSVPKGSFTTVEAAMRDGRVALRPIIKGEPILKERVSGKDGRASIAYDIPEGMRAVSIPVTAVSSVSGFVRPGDVVDVFLTRNVPGGTETKMTEVLLPNVQVLAVDQGANIKNTQPKVGKTAVLLVDLAGAQVLTLAQNVGTMSLALRNIENQEFDRVRIAGARQFVTIRDLNRERPVIRPRPEGGPGPVQAVTPSLAQRGPPRPSGPSMTIVRGTTPTEYQVNRYVRW